MSAICKLFQSTKAPRFALSGIVFLLLFILVFLSACAPPGTTANDSASAIAVVSASDVGKDMGRDDFLVQDEATVLVDIDSEGGA